MTAPRLDVTGLALLSPAVALMLYGLAQVSGEGGFAHRACSSRWRSAPCCWRRSSAGRCARHRRVAPLVNLRLFRVRSFYGAASMMFISGLSMYGALLLLPLYYQQVAGRARSARGC